MLVVKRICNGSTTTAVSNNLVYYGKIKAGCCHIHE